MITARPFKKALATSSTATGFASKVPTITTPSGDGVHDIAIPNSGGSTPERIRIIPWGTGADNGIFEMRVIGWFPLQTASDVKLWIPTVLVGLTCTMGASVGVATAPLVATSRFADTIALVALFDPFTTSDVTNDGTTEVFSPTNDLIAWAEFSLRGAHKIEFTFDLGAGSPTAANALYLLL